MHKPMPWQERAALVRAGAGHLADAPTEVGLPLMHDLFNTILRTSFDAVVLCDRVSGAYLEVSDSFCRLTGHSRAELLGRSSVDLGLVDPLGVRLVAEADALLGHEGMYENTVTRSDGEQRIIEFTHSFLQFGYTLVVARDVTLRKQREDELRRLARVDDLTDLLNRRGFGEAVGLQLDLARRAASTVHLVMLDVDGLKSINDELGHEFGDQALAGVASALTTSFGLGAAIGRLGGDEFAAAVSCNTSELNLALAHLDDAVAALRVGPAGAQRCITVSVGTSVAKRGIGTVDRLVAAADEVQYVAKRARHAARINGS
jgi:diguanylate cyclase (GGDEF)-like protein/PAS domain S-box-containing protein